MTPVKRTVKKKRGRSIKISRKKSRQTHRQGRPSRGIRKTKKKRGGSTEEIENMRDMIMGCGYQEDAEVILAELERIQSGEKITDDEKKYLHVMVENLKKYATESNNKQFAATMVIVANAILNESFPKSEAERDVRSCFLKLFNKCTKDQPR